MCMHICNYMYLAPLSLLMQRQRDKKRVDAQMRATCVRVRVCLRACSPNIPRWTSIL